VEKVALCKLGVERLSRRMEDLEGARTVYGPDGRSLRFLGQRGTTVTIEPYKG
jgi:hypothetical protein